MGKIERLRNALAFVGAQRAFVATRPRAPPDVFGRCRKGLADYDVPGVGGAITAPHGSICARRLALSAR